MYTKGADPEVLLVDPLLKKYVSSVGLIGGSKNYPRPIGEGCAVQEDNVTVEFNIPPCKTADDFIRSINYNLTYLREHAAKMGLEVLIQPSAVYDDDQLTTPEAKTFGCEPDYCAWRNGEKNPRPHADNPNLRSAGGHIHIELPEHIDFIEVVKAMDWFVGCQMMTFDKDNDRRKLYGKAGAFRKKSYGVEYRTASNAWLQSDERIAWVWDQTEKAINWVANGETFTEEQGQMIQDCINNSDHELLKRLSAILPL
jgi:hypothetical protein